MGVYTDKAVALRPVIETAVQNGLDDEQALLAVDLFPAFVPSGEVYVTGMKFKYNGVLYKVLQDHTSQETWTPDTAPSLYAKMLTDPSGRPQVWQQPDSTNAYMTGDQVLYPDESGLVYESTIDNNVWSPADYPQGWRLVES